jgi:hypothetical protein
MEISAAYRTCRDSHQYIARPHLRYRHVRFNEVPLRGRQDHGSHVHYFVRPLTIFNHARDLIETVGAVQSLELTPGDTSAVLINCHKYKPAQRT